MDTYQIHVAEIFTDDKSLEVMTQTDLYFEELGGGLYLCLKDNSEQLIVGKNLLTPAEIRSTLMTDAKVGVYLCNSKQPSILSNFKINP